MLFKDQFLKSANTGINAIIETIELSDYAKPEERNGNDTDAVISPTVTELTRNADTEVIFSQKDVYGKSDVPE